MRKKLVSWMLSAAMLVSCLPGFSLTSMANSGTKDGAGSPQEVMDLIERIFPVTHKSVIPLKEAQTLYQSLSDADKKQVENYAKIADAKAQLQVLHDAFDLTVSGWPASLDGSVTSWMGGLSAEEQKRTRQAMADEIRRLYVEEGYQAGPTQGLALVDTWAPTWTPAGVFINLEADGSDNIGMLHNENWGFSKIGSVISAPYAGMAFSQIRYMSQDYVAKGWTPLLSDTFLYNGRYYSVTWNRVKSYDSQIPEERGTVLTAQQLTYTEQYPGKGLSADGNNAFRYACAKFNQAHKADGQVLGIPSGDAQLLDGIAYQAFEGPMGPAYIAGSAAALKAAAAKPEKPEGAFAIAGELARAFQSLGENDEARFAATGAPICEAYEAEGKLCQDFQLLTLAVDPVTGTVTQTSNDASLRNFSIEGGRILENLGEGINILLPAGTDLTQLTPDFTVHPKSAVSPAKGPQDFTDPVVYTVTSELGLSKEYTVTVVVDGPGSPADRAAAEPVSQAIDRLPAVVSLEDGAQLKRIEEQYEALTPRQRYLVKNAGRLEAALEELRLLNKGKIKVACIGDSITEGDVGGGVVPAAAYPSQLQELLGDRYEVRNFGKCGICVSKNANYSYWGLGELTTSQAYQPDIVIIMLGTNDAWSGNWSNVQNNFESDYLEFVNIYKNLDSQPRIYLTKVCGFYGSDRQAVPTVNQTVERIAEQTGSQLADMYTWTSSLSESDKAKYCNDNLHPNAQGYTLMAQQFKQQIFDPLEDSALKSIELDGRPLEGFRPEDTEYTVKIGRDDPMPVITAAVNSSTASVKITQPTDAAAGATLVVTAGNPFIKRVYTVTVAREGPALLPGDLDGSGEVTIQDVMEACKVLARQSAGQPPTADEMARGDLDGNKVFSISDVMEICKILARGA
ncbi:MAG: hypothetical protein HFE86_06990 [Clostridiales bacterium]|nr:hypothetical protein [Clostridiales bacterium]